MKNCCFVGEDEVANGEVGRKLTLAESVMMPKKAPPVENLMKWDIT
jgi:hypothetical protein